MESGPREYVDDNKEELEASPGGMRMMMSGISRLDGWIFCI